MAIQIRISTALNPRKSGLNVIQRLTYFLIKERDTGEEKVITTEHFIPISKERR